jgi:hypothetical protein
VTPLSPLVKERIAWSAILGSVVAFLLYATCCAPQGPARTAEIQGAVALEKGACAILVQQDPNLGSVCATLDELTPLVPIILARRAILDAGLHEAGGGLQVDGGIRDAGKQ